MCFTLEKASRVSGFLPPSFVCVRNNYSGNLAFRTKGIEDTNLTLAAILFQAEVNNPLIFVLLQTYEKKFAQFPFLGLLFLNSRRLIFSI